MGYQNKSSIRLCDYQKIVLLPEDIRQAEEAAKMAPKENAADTRRYFLQTAFLQKAVEASKIKVSKKEAEERAGQMMRAMDQQLANNGEDFEKYYEGTGTTEKELMDGFIIEAEKQLKSRMVLFEIAKDQNLLATSEEYDAEVHRLSEMSLMPEDRLRQLFEAEEADHIKRDIAISKGAEYIGKLVDARYPAEMD